MEGLVFLRMVGLGAGVEMFGWLAMTMSKT